MLISICVCTHIVSVSWSHTAHQYNNIGCLCTRAREMYLFFLYIYMYKNRIKNEKISRILSILKFLEHIPYTWSIKNSTNTTPHHTTQPNSNTQREYSQRCVLSVAVPMYRFTRVPSSQHTRHRTQHAQHHSTFNGKSNVSCEYEYEYGLDFWAFQINRLGGLACVFYQNFPIFLSSNRSVVTVWFAAKTRFFNE